MMNVHGKRCRPVMLLLGMVCAIVLTGCAGQRAESSKKKMVIDPASLQANLQIIETVMPEFTEVDAGFRALPHPTDEGRDYFTAREVETIEGLLFRFHALQTSLWDIVDGYGGLDAGFADDANGAKAEVLSLTATLLLVNNMALVVEQFAADPVAIKQLNQAYYRSDIPFGFFDRLRESITAPGLADAVADGKQAYSAALNNPESSLAMLARSDSDYSTLIAELPALHDEAERHLRSVAKLYPSHAKVEKLSKEDMKAQHKGVYATQAFVFKNVSRLKSPTAHVLVFSEAQKKAIFDALQPGDLVLTYTAGYMSDVFIPGAFKHGITYIGEQDERLALGLSGSNLPTTESFAVDKVNASLKQATLPNGTSIDMIEAVAEGVIFNNLEHIMDTHVNRMLVLRPRLSASERAAFLVEVYSYLGDSYDFRFDFANASRQVCTEVIYRAINGKGTIDFDLTVRAGHETLSADDIANYYLDPANDAFEFVLLVEPDTGGQKNAATVYTGAEGEAKLRDLMDSVADEG